MVDDSYHTAKSAGEPRDDERLLLDLVRYGLAGEAKAIQHISRRLLRSNVEHSEGFRRQLAGLLIADSGSPVRSAADVALPVEPETRQPLANLQKASLGDPPILAPAAERAIDQMIAARSQASELIEAGVEPPRTLLLTGPPGVGKSMSAGYLAARLGLPLITVELSALMSSFLGKTGQNLARLLEHGREVGCVLFLDEFDAVAKSRDDLTEIGELKRLVNMLLLELDRWPSSGLLVAATNHPQLLDPAVERRFDLIVDLPLPDFDQRRLILARAVGRLALTDLPTETTIAAVALAFDNASGADLERIVSQAARSAVLEREPLSTVLETMALEPLRTGGRGDRQRRAAFAGLATEVGMTQRQVAELLGVTHPTVGALVADWRRATDPDASPKRKGETQETSGGPARNTSVGEAKSRSRRRAA
ncbi:MAG TPA: ATP-binding protein [Solirubrobacterales bacterium]